jgi:hypothetical protein
MTEQPRREDSYARKLENERKLKEWRERNQPEAVAAEKAMREKSPGIRSRRRRISGGVRPKSRNGGASYKKSGG